MVNVNYVNGEIGLLESLNKAESQVEHSLILEKGLVLEVAVDVSDQDENVGEDEVDREIPGEGLLKFVEDEVADVVEEHVEEYGVLVGEAGGG